MATSAGFKQQCPSCEAMVPIKDPRLIGKKIDCPTCKYRFLVEEPDESSRGNEEADGVSAKGKAAETVASKKPAAVPDKKATVKARVGPQRRDDDESAPAKPKKKGSSGVLLVGGGLAGLAILLLGGFVVLKMFGGRDSRPVTKSETVQPAPPPTPDGGQPVAVQPVAPQATDITNLLPGNSETVVACNVKDLLNSPLRHAILDAPGAFHRDTLQAKLGIALADLDRLVLAENTRDDWLFCAVRFNKDIDQRTIKEKWGLTPAPDGPIEGQEYFLAEAGYWLNNASRLADAGLQPDLSRRRPLAVRFHDRQVLVAGDLAVVKQFLQVKGRPAPRTEPDKTKPVPAGGAGTAPPPPKPGTPPPPPPRPGGAPPPPPPAQTGRSSLPVTPTKNYLTINPALKRLLDRMEGRFPTLISSASELTAPRIQARFQELLAVADLKIEELDAFGWAIQRSKDVKERDRELLVLSFGVECKEQDRAQKLPDNIRAKVRQQAQFGPLLGMNLEVGQDTSSRSPIPPPRPIGNEPPKDRPGLTATVFAPQAYHTVVMSVELSPSHLGNSWVVERLRPVMVDLRGLLDMAAGRQSVHQLADALRRYAEKNGKFPRGTLERKVPRERFGRPWPADQRVSWLALLLGEEYGLGSEYRAVRNLIQDDATWKDGDNLKMGAILVPAFLDPRTPRSSWWVTPPSVPDQTMATTQFVGVAGVGLDAAEYQPDDKSVADKLGVFGYDRETSLNDIPADRRGGVIAVLQVPPLYKRPWIAGGGATVQGVPERQSIQPFVCASHPGADGKDQRGTFAIMADGSVRFVFESIPDDVFKAMCTLKGADPALVNQHTILVPPPGKTQLSTPPEKKK